MAKNINQLSVTTTINAGDKIYLGRSPYGLTDDFAILAENAGLASIPEKAILFGDSNGNINSDGSFFVYDKSLKSLTIGAAIPATGYKLTITTAVPTIAYLQCTGSQSTVFGAQIQSVQDDGTAMLTGNQLGGIGWSGSTNASHNLFTPCKITAYAAENWNASTVGAYLSFFSTATGGGSPSRLENMRLTAVGGLVVGNSIITTATTNGQVICKNFTMTTTPTVNYVLTCDASGNASWQPNAAAGDISSVVGTANQITASTVSGAVTLSLPNGISIGSYQATSPPAGGLIAPGSVIIGATSPLYTNLQFQVTAGTAGSAAVGARIFGTLLSTDALFFGIAEQSIFQVSGICKIPFSRTTDGVISQIQVSASMDISNNFAIVPQAAGIAISPGGIIGTPAASSSITTGFGLYAKTPNFGTARQAIYTDNLSIGYPIANLNPTNNLIVSGNAGFGISIPSPRFQVNISGTPTTSTNVECGGLLLNSTISPTFSGTLNGGFIAGISQELTFSPGSGCTVTNAASLLINTGTKAGSGTITNGYSAVIFCPNFGTTRVGLNISGADSDGATSGTQYIMEIGGSISADDGDEGIGLLCFPIVRPTANNKSAYSMYVDLDARPHSTNTMPLAIAIYGHVSGTIGSGVITASYSGYFDAPSIGTARQAIYADNISVGYGAANLNGTNNLVVSGSASIGSSSTSALFNVGSSNQFTVDSNGQFSSVASISGGQIQLIRNTNSSATSYSIVEIGNDTAPNKIVMFVNSSTRTADGGAGNSTIRTDTGNLYLSGGGGQLIQINSSGKVSIGLATTTSPTNILDVNGACAIGSYAGVNTIASNSLGVSGQIGVGVVPSTTIAISASLNNAQSAQFTCTAAQSTTNGSQIQCIQDDASAMLSGNQLGGIGWTGSASASHTFFTPCKITAYAAENWNASTVGAYLSFFSTATGGGSPSRLENMRLAPNGGLCVGNASVTTLPPVGGILTTTLCTTPVSSNTATTAFGTSLTLGTGKQNTTGYDLLVQVVLSVTVAASATVVMGVGSTSTPTTNTAISTFSITGDFTLTAYVPNGYYLLVDKTGTLTSTNNIVAMAI